MPNFDKPWYAGDRVSVVVKFTSVGRKTAGKNSLLYLQAPGFVTLKMHDQVVTDASDNNALNFTFTLPSRLHQRDTFQLKMVNNKRSEHLRMNVIATSPQFEVKVKPVVSSNATIPAP